MNGELFAADLIQKKELLLLLITSELRFFFFFSPCVVHKRLFKRGYQQRSASIYCGTENLRFKI